MTHVSTFLTPIPESAVLSQCVYVYRHLSPSPSLFSAQVMRWLWAHQMLSAHFAGLEADRTLLRELIEDECGIETQPPTHTPLSPSLKKVM